MPREIIRLDIYDEHMPYCLLWDNLSRQWVTNVTGHIEETEDYDHHKAKRYYSIEAAEIDRAKANRYLQGGSTDEQPTEPVQ